MQAHVLEGDLKLQLTVSGRHVVVVLGLLGEPFLRFSAAGVQANAASPTAWNSGVVTSSQAVPASRSPSWRRVTGGHTFAWHENRLRPRPIVAGGASPKRVAPWTIPLVVDGRHVRLTGWEWYAAGPPLRLWLAAVAILIAAAAAAARYGGRALQRVLAAGLVPVAVSAWLAGWIGILLFGRPSNLVIVVAAAYAAATALLVLAAVTATHGNGRMAAAGIVGGLAAVFTVPEVEAFTRGFVLLGTAGHPRPGGGRGVVRRRHRAAGRVHPGDGRDPERRPAPPPAAHGTHRPTGDPRGNGGRTS